MLTPCMHALCHAVNCGGMDGMRSAGYVGYAGSALGRAWVHEDKRRLGKGDDFSRPETGLYIRLAMKA